MMPRCWTSMCDLRVPAEERLLSQWGHWCWPPLGEPPTRRRLGAWESSPAAEPAAPLALALVLPEALALALAALMALLLLLLLACVITGYSGAPRPAEPSMALALAATESCAAACCAARLAASATAAKFIGLGTPELLKSVGGARLDCISADWATVLLAAACAAACDAAMAAAAAAPDVGMCCTAATDALAGERTRLRFLPICSFI